jgi:hypothetical protein
MLTFSDKFGIGVRYYVVGKPKEMKIKFNGRKIACYRLLLLYSKHNTAYRKDRWYDLYLEKKSLAPIYCAKHLDGGGRKVTFYLSRFYKEDEQGRVVYESERVEEPNHYFLDKPLQVPNKAVKDTSDTKVIFEYKTE